mmetsp:Transcript_30860/g.78799  ORF Transcript_30860/g.78799 Transcript_30860/m.78799 type:complete len:93 (-) Transcript_30860:532-810(-)|eukprot:CAMPEP_0202865058 /NCGR_PEP_ID=MMETSP1391-20130828/5167_1 /ASSEMBLY_ACC=CAM_ASM_000867 /TAXON_ID=1034604 /ORGANISM="Chlamydomonas leiostraca, Strain SAG 11-49" /LENGTH=92 /DNA_ID=CAMNT_0049544851 /DNA_START=90 /DNA_END=368 /DNA_ORIENTATION=+
MAFIKRIMDHLLNQVLVETLANSRSFQRFAVWSNSKMKEVSMKGKDGSVVLDETVGKVAEKSKETWSKWREDFASELKKVQEEMARQKAAKK